MSPKPRSVLDTVVAAAQIWTGPIPSRGTRPLPHHLALTAGSSCPSRSRWELFEARPGGAQGAAHLGQLCELQHVSKAAGLR
jgi:hypothetical protein